MNPLVYKALCVSGLALAVAATLNTINWVKCPKDSSKDSRELCATSLNQATTAWTGLGMNALALATNTLKKPDDQ
jgi:hypothetical protein